MNRTIYRNLPAPHALQRCHRCHGSGHAPCPICYGTGQHRVGKDVHGREKTSRCPGCYGRKISRCTLCGGAGFV